MQSAGLRLNIGKKLYLLYMMNAADWICTVVLLSAGGFFEANPIAAGFVGNISLGFLLKCAAPAGVVWLLMGLIRRLDDDSLGAADMAISFGVAFYFLICLDHIANFVILFLR